MQHTLTKDTVPWAVAVQALKPPKLVGGNCQKQLQLCLALLCSKKASSADERAGHVVLHAKHHSKVSPDKQAKHGGTTRSQTGSPRVSDSKPARQALFDSISHGQMPCSTPRQHPPVYQTWDRYKGRLWIATLCMMAFAMSLRAYNFLTTLLCSL